MEVRPRTADHIKRSAEGYTRHLRARTCSQALCFVRWEIWCSSIIMMLGLDWEVCWHSKVDGCIIVAYMIIYAYLFSLVWTPCFKTTGLIWRLPKWGGRGNTIVQTQDGDAWERCCISENIFNGNLSAKCEAGYLWPCHILSPILRGHFLRGASSYIILRIVHIAHNYDI